MIFGVGTLLYLQQRGVNISTLFYLGQCKDELIRQLYDKYEFTTEVTQPTIGYSHRT